MEFKEKRNVTPYEKRSLGLSWALMRFSQPIAVNRIHLYRYMHVSA